MSNSAVPFQLKNNVVWVSATVNGERLTGILDSDSDETYLDERTALRLKIAKQQDQTIEFDLGSAMLFIPQKPRIVGIEDRYPGMQFILGFDAMGGTPFTVDYRKELINLGTLPQGSAIPFRTGKSVPSVPVTFSNMQINSVVDTGAPAGLDLPYAWVKSNLPRVRFEPAVERKDLGPRFEAYPFLLDEIRIGHLSLLKVEAEAIRSKNNPSGDQGDEWATIGNRLLKRFSQIGINGPGRNCVFVR